MSTKKITDADKLEIVDLYRQGGETTTSLANRYGVSSSTISRILKTSIPDTEYDLSIRQRRGAKASGAAERSLPPADLVVTSAELPTTPEINYGRSQTSSVPVNIVTESPADPIAAAPQPSQMEDLTEKNRRVRRRSSAPLSANREEPTAIDRPWVPPATTTAADELPVQLTMPIGSDPDLLPTNLATKPSVPPPIPRTPVLREILADSEQRYLPPLEESGIDELEEDADTEDVNALAAMFGEEIADSEDDDEDFAEEDWEDEASSSYQQLDRDRILTSDRLHVQVTPLSEAKLPRTCYVVIDKFAELIVRPLKDFADLGQISGEEIQQRTLPVFDNHRIAKRFSNQRTQRVIKVPDSRVFYKTTQHLRLKGITRLLVDGNIYSLN